MCVYIQINKCSIMYLDCCPLGRCILVYQWSMQRQWHAWGRGRICLLAKMSEDSKYQKVDDENRQWTEEICLYFATSYQSCFICQMTAATYKLQNQTPWWNKTCRPNTNVLLADTIVFYKWWVVWIHHWPILTNFLGGHPLQPEPSTAKMRYPHWNEWKMAGFCSS